MFAFKNKQRKNIKWVKLPKNKEEHWLHFHEETLSSKLSWYFLEVFSWVDAIRKYQNPA